MQKKTRFKSKLTQEEIQQRLTIIETAEKLEDLKRNMSSRSSEEISYSSEKVPVESLMGIGLEGDELYKTVVTEYKEFLDAIGEFAFGASQRERYFKNNKIKSLLQILQLAGLPLQVRSMMDIFKDRVKQRNGGNLPVLSEKVGLFGKAVNRPMKLDEIASKYDIEVDMPPGVDRPLTVCGTQVGLLHHLHSIVLEDEDVRDILKRNARKLVARFLKAAGLINFETRDPDEKCLIAALVTPEAIQPRSPEDRDQLLKFRSILRKGKKWIDNRLEAANKDGNPSPEGEEKEE